MSDAIVWTVGTVQPTEVAEMTTRHVMWFASNRMDCRPEFTYAFEKMEETSFADTFDPITLTVPFINQDKAFIVRTGEQLGVPYHLTWSCYKGGAIHCGVCGTCVERKEAFQLAGVNDPTIYEE